MAASAFALAMAQINIWREFQDVDEVLIRMFVVGAISAIALAYVSLIFLLRGRDTASIRTSRLYRAAQRVLKVAVPAGAAAERYAIHICCRRITDEMI